MASILLIILSSLFLLHISLGNNEHENEGKYNILLEKMQDERHIKMAKRSISRENEIGGLNENGIMKTTTESNLIQYSLPRSEITSEVDVKLITTTSAVTETQRVATPISSDTDLNNETENNNVTADSSVSNQVNDINNTYTSDDNTLNSNFTSTAISKSAIFSSNNTGAILYKHAMSASQNESKNDTADDLATPVTATRENVHNISTSSNRVGNHNSSTQANKVNEIPQATTESEHRNSLVQTTSDNMNSTTLKTTVETKSESTSETTVRTTLQTQTESQSNYSNQSPAQSPNGSQPVNGSNGDNVVSETSEPSNKTTENNGSVTNSSSKTQTFASSTTTSAPTTGADILNTNQSANEESIPENEVSANPEFGNNTESNLPENEPIPEPENNATNGRLEMSTEPFSNHTANTTTVVPKVETTVSPIVNVSAEQDNANTTKSPINTTNIPKNVSDSLVNESAGEPNSTVNNTKSVTSNTVTTTSTNYSTAFDKSGMTETVVQKEKTSTEPSTTKVNSTLTNLTTTTEEPGDQANAEPEESVTEEQKYKNVTSEPVGENTTNKSSSTVTYPTTSTVSKMTVPSPEPSSKSNTTVHPEPPNSETTTVNRTVEPSAEPENHTQTKQDHNDTTTQSTPHPIEENDDKTNDGDETEVEPEPEDGDPEPESEIDNDKDQLNTDAFAEPGPDWKLAKALWKEAWEFHVYFFGIAFSLLGFYCLLTLIRLWYMEHMLSKHYFITLQILVILVCTLRATYLMVDAYNSLGTFPYGVDYFLYSTAFPCLTALFSILFYALLLATRVQVISKKVQKLWVLILIITFHFVLSIVTDIVVGLFTSASVMIFVCQAFFVIWGLLMFVGYFVIFRKLYKGAINRKNTMMGGHSDHKSNAAHPPSKQKYTLGLAVKVTFITAFFGVAIVGSELYGMFGVYGPGVLKSNTKPDPWPWWTYHTIVRSLECFMCLTVAYVASQPLRFRMKKNTDHKIYHYLLPCSICCCPDKLDQNETYSSSISLDYVAPETDHLSWLKKIKNKKTASPEAPYPPHTAEKYADPDATLLVRKVKRNSKPSMLVVEDGFVRIRREDEIMPSNQYELDSGSSHSSDTNRPGVQSTRAIASVVNWNYTDETNPNYGRENVTGVNFDNYLLQGNETHKRNTNNEESADDTDIDIVVTESEQEDDNHELSEGDGSVASNNSVDIFRPLSMIDLATSMESELDRAFNLSCVEETDLISHNSLPGCNTDWNDSAYNEHLCDKYPNNREETVSSYLDNTHYSSDSADDQSKSSGSRLLRPPVRRCKSDDSKSSSPKCKHFEKNKYYSVSGVDSLGKDDEVDTRLGSNGELRTEL